MAVANITKEELKSAFQRNCDALKELGLSAKQIGYLIFHGEEKLALQHVNAKAYGAKGVKRADVAVTSLLVLAGKKGLQLDEIRFDDSGRLVCKQKEYVSPEHADEQHSRQAAYTAQSNALLEKGYTLWSIASTLYLGDDSKSSINRVTSKRSGLVAVTKADCSLILIAGLVDSCVAKLDSIKYNDTFNALIKR